MWDKIKEFFSSVFKSKEPTPAPMPPAQEAPKEEIKAEVPKESPKSPSPKKDKIAAAIIAEAEKWLHVREHGTNAGKEVEIFQKFLGIGNLAWCMCFAQYVTWKGLGSIGLKPKIKKSAGCQNTWNDSPSDLKLKKPHVGGMVIWKKKGTGNGHVGIVVEIIDDEHFMTIEGNTGPGPGVEREGDGVYRKKRSVNGWGDMQIMGFLKPL